MQPTFASFASALLLFSTASTASPLALPQDGPEVQFCFGASDEYSIKSKDPGSGNPKVAALAFKGSGTGQLDTITHITYIGAHSRSVT